MAINTRKISVLPELGQLTGGEYLMVAKNNRSYKVNSNVFTSDKIESIVQVLGTGDGAKSTITVTLSNGTSQQFEIYNGQKGSVGEIGPTGKKGETGDSGIILFNQDQDFEDYIVDSLDGTGTNIDGEAVTYTDEELAKLILSAKQGSILNHKLDKLEEEYLTESQYDALVNRNLVKANVKYFILEDEEE